MSIEWYWDPRAWLWGVQTPTTRTYYATAGDVAIRFRLAYLWAGPLQVHLIWGEEL